MSSVAPVLVPEDDDSVIDTDIEICSEATNDIFVLESSDSDVSDDDVIIQRVKQRRHKRVKVDGSFRRNAPIRIEDTVLDRLKINYLWLKPQMDVQLGYKAILSDGKTLGDGYFMRLKRIVRRVELHKNGTEMTQDWVQGLLFRRNRELDGILPRTAGEVALMREHAEVRACDVVNVREIIMTNQLGPHSARRSYRDAKDDSYGRLICRWKAKIKDNIDGKTGVQQLGATGYIRRLTEAEADAKYRVSDRQLSKSWRKIPEEEENEEDKRAFPDSQSSLERISTPAPVKECPNAVRDAVDIVDPDEQSSAPDQITSRIKSQRRYTFGDAFCGAGGATRGATTAGFKIRYGIDHDENAITAWKSNFGRKLGYHEDVHKFFAEKPRSKTYVDLLHLSPPCQFFSWARTVAGKNDDQNEASFFCVPNTLKSSHPRAVTVEETDGLVGLSRTVSYFKCLLGDFTSAGYSVKYAVLNAALYGVPSRRKRLILIACCPGETLADFPSPTHFYSSDPSEPMPRGLKRAVTLRQTLSKIPAFASDNDAELLETVAPSSLRLAPHEWDEPFRSTIKCAGGEYNLHPDRNRKFTLRELSSLQSFPWDHLFHGTKSDKMRQIGNAFPPKLVGAVMKSVRKHLEKTDEEWEGGGIL